MRTRMARTGRRPGPTTSRAAILEAARRRFAQVGYDATAIRTIAAEAGVNAGVGSAERRQWHGACLPGPVGGPHHPGLPASRAPLGDDAQAELRANLAAAQLIGVALLRYVLRVEPIASVELDTLVTWLAPALTHCASSDGLSGLPSDLGR